MKTPLPTLVVLVLIGCSSAWALSYDQNVVQNSPGGEPTGNDPGIFYGTGNANGGFTVDANNNVELGLRTHVRYPVPLNVFNSNGDGTYSYTDATGIGPSNRADWNFDFSIDVNQSGTGMGSLADFTFLLEVDQNPGVGTTFLSLDPLDTTIFTDDAYAGSPFYIAQNSENAGFGFIPGYDKDAAATYDIRLSAFDLSGNLVAQTLITVFVNGGASVPEGGATVMLLGISFLCLGGLGLRTRRNKA